MTLTEAKKAYRLRDQDVAPLHCQLRPNPFHRKFKPMVREVILKCRQSLLIGAALFGNNYDDDGHDSMLVLLLLSSNAR